MKWPWFFAILIAWSTASAAPLQYDFSSRDLNGWKVVMGEPAFWNGGLAGSQEEFRDEPHPTFLARSPMFRLEETGGISVTLKSGRGGKIPTSPRALEKNTTDKGPLGFALRRVSDDAWLLVGRLNSNGATGEILFSENQLRPLIERAQDEVYTLDFFDASHGGWGHVQLISAEIPGTLVPEPPKPPEGFENARPLFLGATHGKLAFDKTQMFALPGSKISITLFNSDEMAHNWVLCKPDPKVADELGLYVMNHIAEMTAADFVPKDPRILKHSTLVAPGISDTQYLQVPTELGDYPYVCTFPGHHITMRGVLSVVEELPLPNPEGSRQVEPADEFTLKVESQPVIQRGPLEGGFAATVCVGTPEGVGFAFDTDACEIVRVWKAGDQGFLNAKEAWGGRGGKALKPVGAMVFSSDGEAGPKRKFTGYELAENGLPVFTYRVGNNRIRHWVEIQEGALVEYRESPNASAPETIRHDLSN